MRNAGLIACLILACILAPVVLAQAAKPELQSLDFNTLDRNHDGRISPREAQADAELALDFATLDQNHDGYLSLAEFQAWPRANKTKTPDPSTAPGGSSGAQHLPKC